MFSSAAYGSLAHFSGERFSRHTEDSLPNLFLSFEQDKIDGGASAGHGGHTFNASGLVLL